MFYPNVTCSRLRREDRTGSVRPALLQRVPTVRCGQAARELQQTPHHGYGLLNYPSGRVLTSDWSVNSFLIVVYENGFSCPLDVRYSHRQPM